MQLKKNTYGLLLLLAALLACSLYSRRVHTIPYPAARLLHATQKSSDLASLYVQGGNGIYTACRHSTGNGPGECAGSKKSNCSGGLFGGYSTDIHACTVSVVTTACRKLLQYHTFSQLSSLFPRHWFW